jgi:hypothetical protein
MDIKPVIGIIALIIFTIVTASIIASLVLAF